jgi:anti-anti-sigma factor
MSDAIAYAVKDCVCFLKLSGELRHDSAGPLDTLIERLFATDGSGICAVMIDLNDVEFMDSTVIGLLAGIARELLSRDLPAPTLFSTNEDINELLRSLRFDDVFTLIDQRTDRPLAAGALRSVEELPGDQQHCSAATILKAHEALIEMNEANRDAFQSVVDLFRAEVGRET